MIKQVRLTNFFSFRDTAISLAPGATVMVGINGSGKSNLIKAIRLLHEGIAGKDGLRELFLSWGGFDEVFFKGEGENEFPNSIGLSFWLDGPKIARYGYHFREDLRYDIRIIRKPGQANYSLREKLCMPNARGEYLYLDFSNGKGVLNERSGEEASPTGLVRYEDKDPEELVLRTIFDSDRYYALSTIRQALADIAVYEYFNTTPESPMRKAAKATAEKRLLHDGRNLATIINTIKITHKPSFRRIEEMLQEVNAHFRGFDFRFLGSSGTLELLLDEGGLLGPVHITHLSDGTLRYLCLLVILFNPSRGSFVCIDEPEVGLHPDMLRAVSNAIQEAAGESSMLVATHSEHILNQFQIRDIRVFEKEAGNATAVLDYQEEDFAGWYESFSPGHMWRAGDLGGNRF
ncbi:MAG: AAA family ATPase [Bacteroidia bacterium]|nr:AAA family ATPase [Bacteroidia bacterium]